MTQTTTSDAIFTPILARWKQSTKSGTVTWHLASLNDDGSFWGYVHFRTEERSENRTIAGRLNTEAFQSVRRLVRELGNCDACDDKPKPVDALIGVGSRASFRHLFRLRDGKPEPDDSRAVQAFESIVEILQPRMMDAIQA
jgi:hypothetical protein